MGMQRLMKMPKVLNKQALMMKRREPYRPVPIDRRDIEDRTRLEAYEQRCAEGVTFVPDDVLPPWKRSLVQGMKRTPDAMNFRGFRVRAADKQDEPGFPTHFR